MFEGSGRFADELSAAMRNPTLDTSAAIREIARSGHARLFSIDEPSAELRKSCSKSSAQDKQDPMVGAISVAMELSGQR